MASKRDSIIVDFWLVIFHFLRKISVFSLLRVLFPKVTRNYLFVDLWVMGNAVTSVIATIVIVHWHVNHIVGIVISLYGFLRVFEVIVYQVNVLLFDDIRAFKLNNPYVIKGYRRMIILLLHNYVEIIFWFAASYGAILSDFSNAPTTVIGMIYTSFVTMASFNANIKPLTTIGTYIISFQAVIGLFMTLISLARFISLFPNPESWDDHEQSKNEIEKVYKDLDKINRKLDRLLKEKGKEN